MELTCPHCAARYRVPEDAVPPEGRTIQCAKCAQGWFQPGADAGPRVDAAEESAIADAGAADVYARGGAPGEAVSDFGALDNEFVAPMPLPSGPAASAPAAVRWDDEEPVPGGGGLGTVGWVLLLLVIALLAAGGYAYWAGLLKLPA